VTEGGGVPLILQSKRAARPSSTSASSSNRVNRGAREGRTVSRALQVSSSGRKGSSTGVGKAVEAQALHLTHPAQLQGAWAEPATVVGMRTEAMGKDTQTGPSYRVGVCKDGQQAAKVG
jgi:hypothetical protein